MWLAEYISEKLIDMDIDICIDDYGFLDTTPELQDPIFVCLGGSYAYGTNTPTSDLDIRGVACHSKDEILLGHGFEQVINEPTDTVIYSLRKLCNLLVNCNPNTIEILGVKPEHRLYVSSIGEELIKNRDMFLSMKCVSSFMGYANQQMYRLQQKSLVALSEEDLNKHIVNTLNGMKQMLAEQMGMTNIDVRLKDGQIVIDGSMKDYPAENLSKALGALNNTLQDYHKRSVRNEKAMEHGKIAKHSMHLLRLYMMCEDILLYGEINTYREKEHDLLMDVRNGKYLGEDGRPNKEFFDLVRDYESRLEYAKEHAVIPKKPDTKRIDDFLKKVNLEVIMRG